MSTGELDALEQLERIVPEDISDWPIHARVIYLQTRALTIQVAGLTRALEGKDGVKATLSDHERRIKFIEAVLAWGLGIGTTVIGALAVAAALSQTIWKR